MLIAQISDLHIRPKGSLAYGISPTNLYAEHATHALLRLAPQPDCVLVTGDLTDCGLDEEYAILTDLFDRLPMPVYCIPGNHDRRDPFRRAFAAGGYLPETGLLNYVVTCGPARIIALDSLAPGKSHGELLPETLDFLATALEEAPDAPTLIMLHHPPFDTGIGHMDRQRLLVGDTELAQIVAQAPQVERILCGHLHRSIQVRFAGTLARRTRIPAPQPARRTPRHPHRQSTTRRRAVSVCLARGVSGRWGVTWFESGQSTIRTRHDCRARQHMPGCAPCLNKVRPHVPLHIRFTVVGQSVRLHGLAGTHQPSALI